MPKDIVMSATIPNKVCIISGVSGCSLSSLSRPTPNPNASRLKLLMPLSSLVAVG